MKPRRKEGFAGQRLLVLPPAVVAQMAENPLTAPLHLTHIGYYPVAAQHWVERPAGAGALVLIYCVSGQGWVEQGGYRRELPAHHASLLPAESGHRYGSEAGWEIYFWHLAGRLQKSVAQRFAQAWSTGVGAVPFESGRLRLFEDMYRHLEAGYSPRHLEHVNLGLWALLDSLLYPPEAQPHRQGITPEDRAIAFMQRALHQKLNLPDLAEAAGLSVSHFSSRFRQATGYAPMDYFFRLKVQRACQYLDLTHLQVQEIAYKLGIEDPFYFSRRFKQVMGISPQGYRRRGG
ncbi:MAG: AraC family transcriptional regulator [Bacteroidetes bacterium]|nr:MAG: AraC family transcriptional regulator [Bacteroidota bacterium]